MPEKEKIEETFETLEDVQAFLRSVGASMHVCSARGQWHTRIARGALLLSEAADENFVVSVRKAIAFAMVQLQQGKVALEARA